MTYQESLEWLDSSRVFGIKLGLANTRLLFEALGNPQDSLSIFHVAGTNGKGSVCAMLDSILRTCGLRTGLYTSPHLVDFRERIRVNGEKIPKEAVASALTRIRQATADWDRQPTFFEIVTAMAVSHFAAEGCQAVVLETGMGGRLDATNAMTPIVSVVTPIGMDHRQWLGNTLEEIAVEKAGIIKPGIPVVSAPQEPAAAEVLRDCAERLNTDLEFVTTPLEGVPISLKGSHQKLNAALAVEAVKKMGVELNGDIIRYALANVKWPGRFQVVDNRIVLDGAHNPHAAESLVRNWKEVYGREPAVVVFGALADKDYPVIIEKLEPIASEFYFVPVKNSRSATPEELASACMIKNQVVDSLHEALVTAKGHVLVTGSLFLVGEAMGLMGIEP